MTLIAPVVLSDAVDERCRDVVERELVRGETFELVAPAASETSGGRELGLALAAAVAERSEQRDLLHHQPLQVDRHRLVEGAQHDDPAAAADDADRVGDGVRGAADALDHDVRAGAPFPTRSRRPRSGR